MPEREDLFAHYAGQDEGQRLFRFGHNRLELLRTRELLQRQLPSPPAAVLDVGGGTGVYAAWVGGPGLPGAACRHRPRACQRRS